MLFKKDQEQVILNLKEMHEAARRGKVIRPKFGSKVQLVVPEPPPVDQKQDLLVEHFKAD